jgi:hypothetical protein
MQRYGKIKYIVTRRQFPRLILTCIECYLFHNYLGLLKKLTNFGVSSFANV